MSRLYGLFCEEPVKLACSEAPSRAAGYETNETPESPAEADGWGIGLYRNRGSFLYKKATKSSGAHRISSLTEVLSSAIFISHVRFATVGDRRESNTQPFRWGLWLFAHQGTIKNFRRVRSKILRKLPSAYKKMIGGSTDSEHCFYLYLSLLRGEGAIKKGDIPLEAAVENLRKFGDLMEELREEAEISEKSLLNFLISNGTYLIALRRGDPLYYLDHRGGAGEDPVFVSDVTGLKYEIVQFDHSRKFVVISSERLTASPNWQEIPDNSILTVNPAQEIEIFPWSAGRLS